MVIKPTVIRPMVRRIIVTGGSGMLGANLVQRLRGDGHDVSGVDIRDTADEVADIRDLAAMTRAFRGADAVVHTASALPTYPADQIRSIIVDGTSTVLAAARAAGVGRFVHISSTAVYGLPVQVPTVEDQPHAPVDHYSAAKSAAELIAAKWRDTGMCVPILRPKTFLGPGRMGLFAMLFEWADEGRHFPVLGSGDVRVQMFAIADLVDAIVTVLDAPDDVAGDTYNLAAAEFGTIREDFQAVLDEAGHGKRVVSLPGRPTVAVLGLLQRVGLSPVYNRLLHKLLADSYVSIDKARERLGFSPAMSNRDAILATYRWWRENRPQQGAASGRTSREPWRQGALGLAKAFF